MNRNVSKAEIEYIVSGVEDGVRGDGRGALDFRSISVEDQILPHVNGSSKVSIGNDTEMICSVKATVGEPLSDSQASGIVDICIDVSQYTNVRIDERRLQDFGSNLAEIIKR